MNLLFKTLVLLLLAAPALAGPYEGSSISTATGKATRNLSGSFGIAASSGTSSAYTIHMDGQSGSIQASSGTFVYSVKSATAAFGPAGTTLPSGAAVISSGTVVIQSTSSAATHQAFKIQNQSGTELFRVQQDGKVAVSSSTPTDEFSVQGNINANGYKAGTTAGTSVTCTAGQYLNSSQVKNGITVAGTCATAGTGDAILSATQTFTGDNTFSTVRIKGSQGIGIGPGLMVLVSSQSFSAVHIATVTIPSTGTYKSYYITADVQNVNAAARSFLVYVGTETSTGHAFGMASAASNASNNASGCVFSAGAVALSYTAANATNVGINADGHFRMELNYISTNIVMGSWRYSHHTGAVGSIFVEDHGGFYYRGGAVPAFGDMHFFMGTTTSCTVSTPSAASLTGTFYVYAMPF